MSGCNILLLDCIVLFWMNIPRKNVILFLFLHHPCANLRINVNSYRLTMRHLLSAIATKQFIYAQQQEMRVMPILNGWIIASSF